MTSRKSCEARGAVSLRDGDLAAVRPRAAAHHPCATDRAEAELLDESPLLLGRLDVFDQLDVEFRQRTNAILLRPAAR
jgi:hypothetical protein